MKTLKQRIVAYIRENGPLTIASYMSWCLHDPEQGYYPTHDPLGRDGDFITAPEISQMFGEVLGLSLIQSWRNMGEPKTVHLVEYGPGHGVMMNDILRAAKLDSGFFKGVRVWLIETSSTLETRQEKQLANCGVPVRWITSLDDIPEGSTLIVGNEYLDCLPMRQFVMKDRFRESDGWHERVVDIDPGNENALTYAMLAAPVSKADQKFLPRDISRFKQGDLLEIHPGLAQIIEDIKTRFEKTPGAALFLDYGPEETGCGDSFQALKKHKKVDPLAEPGLADLTAHVNFAALKKYAKVAGLSVYGPEIQSRFLSRLGIEVRAAMLSKSAPDAKSKISRQLHRLMDPEEMGSLFKAIAIQSSGLPRPLGFDQ